MILSTVVLRQQKKELVTVFCHNLLYQALLGLFGYLLEGNRERSASVRAPQTSEPTRSYSKAPAHMHSSSCQLWLSVPSSVLQDARVMVKGTPSPLFGFLAHPLTCLKLWCNSLSLGLQPTCNMTLLWFSYQCTSHLQSPHWLGCSFRTSGSN